MDLNKTILSKIDNINLNTTPLTRLKQVKKRFRGSRVIAVLGGIILCALLIMYIPMFALHLTFVPMWLALLLSFAGSLIPAIVLAN